MKINKKQIPTWNRASKIVVSLVYGLALQYAVLFLYCDFGDAVT